METTNTKKRSALFDKLVPVEGQAATVEGEMIRAISRIGYRYSNDGDYFYKGYGCETAGPAHAYLVGCSPIGSDLEPILAKAVNKIDEAYEKVIDEALGLILTYVEGRESYTPNTTDMWDCESLFEEDEDEEEDWEEDEDEEEDWEEDEDWEGDWEEDEDEEDSEEEP